MAFTPGFGASKEWTDHQWGLVLAGGDGTRLQHFVRNELGHERPKQFCAIVGKRSMLRHTIDRVSPMFPQSRLLTVVSRHHLSYAAEELPDRDRRTLIIEPTNCETGPGILLPLLHIYLSDPRAIVAIFPSDHFIVEEERFMEHVCAAFSFVSTAEGFVVALGIKPSGMQRGYGWIEKGEWLATEGGMNLHRVRKFWEKPNQELMERLCVRGCLWNTLTLVGRAATFISMFQEYTPEIFNPFQRIWNVLDTPRETEVTEEVFKEIPSVTFSHAVLERAPQRLCVLEVGGVYWSDWGDESRIRSDLARIKSPQGARRVEEPIGAEWNVPSLLTTARVAETQRIPTGSTSGLLL